MQSIINKVRSRVSSILPNSLTKWFSHGTNGNLRRRRNDSESDEDEDDENSNVQEQEDLPKQHRQPPTKRSKVVSSLQELLLCLFLLFHCFFRRNHQHLIPNELLLHQQHLHIQHQHRRQQ